MIRDIDRPQETKWCQLQVASFRAMHTQPGTLSFITSCVCSPVTSCQSGLLGNLVFSSIPKQNIDINIVVLNFKAVKDPV